MTEVDTMVQHCQSIFRAQICNVPIYLFLFRIFSEKLLSYLRFENLPLLARPEVHQQLQVQPSRIRTRRYSTASINKIMFSLLLLLLLLMLLLLFCTLCRFAYFTFHVTLSGRKNFSWKQKHDHSTLTLLESR